jgi:hypothetical protein
MVADRTVFIFYTVAILIFKVAIFTYTARVQFFTILYWYGSKPVQTCGHTVWVITPLLMIFITFCSQGNEKYVNNHGSNILVGSVKLIFLFFCVVVLCVFTFWVPCCDVRYDFHIKTIFGSSLPPFVWRRAHVLFTLFVFVCI